MKFFMAEDLASQFLSVSRPWGLRCQSIELKGEAGSFGEIWIDEKKFCGILIKDEEKILDELERFMVDKAKLVEQALAEKFLLHE